MKAAVGQPILEVLASSMKETPPNIEKCKSLVDTLYREAAAQTTKACLLVSPYKFKAHKPLPSSGNRRTAKALSQ